MPNMTECDTCCSGQPQEIPEHYVPSAYREWDVQLYDWQTQCSSQALPNEGLRLSLKRLMPTVGVRPCCPAQRPACVCCT